MDYPRPISQHYSLQVCRFPGNNQEHPRSSGYLIGLMKSLCEIGPTLGRVTPYTVADTPIPMSRNRAVMNALDNGVDYILMIDSDMDPDLYLKTDPLAKPFFETAWKFMMDRRIKEAEARGPHGFEAGWDERIDDRFQEYPPATIAAPYCGPPPDECCYVFEWKNRESDNPNPDFKLGMIAREKAAILSGIQEMAALPTGLILYDSRVFSRLPVPWFAYEYTDDRQTNKATTEDVYQTRNASLLGMPQYIAWDCWAGHVKPKTVGKPRLVHPDLVSSALRDSMNNIRSDQRVKFVEEVSDV